MGCNGGRMNKNESLGRWYLVYLVSWGLGFLFFFAFDWTCALWVPGFGFCNTPLGSRIGYDQVSNLCPRSLQVKDSSRNRMICDSAFSSWSRSRIHYKLVWRWADAALILMLIAGGLTHSNMRLKSLSKIHEKESATANYQNLVP